MQRWPDCSSCAAAEALALPRPRSSCREVEVRAHSLKYVRACVSMTPKSRLAREAAGEVGMTLSLKLGRRLSWAGRPSWTDIPSKKCSRFLAAVAGQRAVRA